MYVQILDLQINRRPNFVVIIHDSLHCKGDLFLCSFMRRNS